MDDNVTDILPEDIDAELIDLSYQNEELDDLISAEMPDANDDAQASIEEATKQLQLAERIMEMRTEKIKEALINLGLDESKITQWKDKYKGAVYVFAPSDTDMYVYRPIFHPEWHRVQTKLRSIPGITAEAADTKMKNIITKMCVLHPALTDQRIQGSRAGLVDSLFEVITQVSYFYTPDQAISFVVEL